MANNIAGYIANLGKSVAYSASDKMKNMTPATAEFANTNAELFKSVYNNIRDYKITYKRSKDLFQKSKVYEAADVLKTSLFEDIKSGKLYNKEREDKMSMKMLGMSSDSGNDGFDDSMLNFDDFDFSDITDFESDDFSTGDKIVSATIDSSTRKSAEMISKVTARTGEYIVENQKMNTNILYTQNMQGFGMLNSNLTSINENIGQMINFSNEAIGQHLRTSADYYTKSIELMQDQTALLREIAGYLKPAEKKEDKSRDKITYDDIVGAEGTPDLKMYIKRVKKNIESNSGLGMLSSMNNMFGEDGNALATLMASPLKFIPNYIVNSVVPNAVEASMKDLDKSFGNLFGSLIAKLNTMAKDEDNKLASTIGGIFGISTSAKSDLDTSKYEKGKVDWDGKSRKALIEVIPTQLAKIVSLLSGQEETVYDYDKGKFIKASSIKNEYENKLKSYGKNATSDMRDFFDEYSKLLVFNSMEERKKFKEDVDKFFTKLYEDGRMFDVNSKTLDEDHMDYGIDSKNFRAIRALYKNAPRHLQHSINNDILYNRNRQTAEFEALEKAGTSNLMYMFNGSNINEFIKENKLDKRKVQSTSLLARGFDKITDNYGKNIFYYLQNMYKELSFIRQYGTMSGSGRTMPHIPNSMKIMSSDGTEYVPESKTINDVIIPRNKQYSDSENKIREEERQRQRFINSEKKRLEKNQSLIKYSEIDDDKMLENHLSAMIGVEKEKKRLEEEKNKKKSLVDKLLEAGSLSEKTSLMFSKLNDVTSKPMKFVTGIIENVDKRMYEFVYGKEDANGDVKGFLDLTLYELKNTFNKFNSFLDEKILTPLKEKLDADTMKDVFKNLLGKMGIDVDHLSETIKSFFFGEKDADGKRKGGIFGETIEATKEAGKNVFGFVKDSFKDTFSPLINKGKDLFKSKNTVLFKDLDEIDDDYSSNDTRTKSLVQQRIDYLTDKKNITGKTQEYYNSIDWDSKDNKDYYIRNNYLGGIRNIKAEETELNNIEEKISKLKIALNSTTGNNKKKISNEIKKLEKRRNFLLDNITEFYKNGNTYKDKLMVKKYNNIKKYYSKNIASALGLDSESDGVNDILNELFESNKDKYMSTGFKDFTAEDFMRSARNLSKSTGDNKYESVIDNIANYLDKYYNEYIGKKLSEIADDSGKLIDPDNWYRTEGLPTTAEEFYKQFPNLVNSNELLLDETKEGNNIFNQIAEDIRELRNIFSSIGKNRKQTTGPRIGLRPELINNPEGRATHAYAQDLATMIANWMYGNMSHFDEGGYIDRAMVATVGEGEVVLSKENVERLTSIYTELLNDVKDKEKSISGSATKAFDKLLPMVKNGEITHSNFKSISEKVLNENPYLNMAYNENSRLNNEVFARLHNAIIINEKNPSNLNGIQQALYNDTKPFVEKMGEELISGLGSVKRSLFGTSEKDDKKNFGDMITDVTSNISKYAPKAIGAGVVGGGISLLTGALGGPLLGAAVGAGISLTKQSEGVQKFLFGELDENGERKGGLVGKNAQDIFKKYIPDMGKLGLVGGLVAPLLTPLGPVGGIIAGSALGFAKNNKSVMDALFGEKGLFESKDKEKLEKLMPKLALGAGIGAFTGPFGLMGNILLGSGIAMATTSQGFKEAIFGKYNDNTGQFESGLLPSMREYIINPLKENAKEYKDTFFEYLREQIFKPVTSAIDPIRTEIAYMVKRPFEKLEEMIVEKIDKSFAPLRDAIQDKFVKPLTDKAKSIIGGMFKIAGNIIASPFKAIGSIGDNLRMKQIAQGRASYMTAEERINARNKLALSNPMKFAKFMDKDQTGDMDIMLSNLTKQDPSKIQELAEMVNAASDTKSYMLSKRRSLGKDIGSQIGEYFTHSDTKRITKAISKGDARYAMELMEQMSMREGIPEEKRNEFLKHIQKKVNEFNKFEDNRDTQDRIRNSMYEELRKMGIKDISDKNLKKYQKYINNELAYSKKNKENKNVEEIQGPITPELAYYRDSLDILKSIASLLEKNNGIGEETNTVIEELVDNSGNSNVIEEKNGKKVIIGPDGKPKTIKKTSDGEWEEDLSDKGNNKTKSGEVISELVSTEEEEEYEKQKSSKKGILFTALNAFKGLKTAVATTLGIIMAPKIIEAAKQYVFPLVGEMWNKDIKPWVEEEGIPLLIKGMKSVGDLVKDGLVYLAENIIPMITESVKFTVTEIVPALAKGIKDAIKALFGKDENSEDDVLQHISETATRQVVTGGRVSSLGLKTLNRISGREARMAAKLGVDIVSDNNLSGAGKLLNKVTTGIGKAAYGTANFIDKIPLIGTKFKLGRGITELGIKAGEQVGKVANASSKILDKIDNTAVLSTFRNKAQSVFKSTSTSIGEGVIKLSENNIIAKSLAEKMSGFLDKLFNSKTLKFLLDDNTIAKLTSEFAPNFIKAIGEAAVKNADKIATKAAGFLSTGGLLNIALAVGDFISGFNDAKNILSIVDEPSLGMKIASGLLKAINGFFIITSIIPEKVYVDLLLDHVAKAGFDDIKKQRQEAKSIVDKYNKENNTKLTVREYNNKVKEDKKKDKYKNSDTNGDGKVSAWEKLKTNVSNGINKFKSFFSFGKGEELEFEISPNTIAGKGISNSIGKGKYIGKGGSKSESKTPKRVNNFSYFSQYDNKWGNDENSMIKKAGCGPTSLAMLLTESLGRTITPDEISTEAYSKGLWNEKGSSSEIFSYFGNKYNVPVKDVKKSWDTFDQLASQGVPQAVSGKGTAPYTTTGHIITVLGKDANGNYIVNDPLSIQRSKTYTINDIKNGWNNSWAFGGDNLLSINDFNMQNPEIVGLGNDAKIKMYEKVIQYARAFKGKLKYSMDSSIRQWINKNKLGADCSSFTQHIFKTVAGVNIGANTGEQLTKNTRLSSPDQGQPGDLILFKGTYKSPHPEGVSHVGIISDNNGNMIDQGSSGAAPKERSYRDSYWGPKQLAAVRVLPNPNELVDPVVQGGNTAVGDVVGTSLGLTNSGEATTSTDVTSETTQPETGFSAFMSDLTNTATAVVNKMYKFDNVAGMGGVDRTILPPVPRLQYNPKWNLNGQGSGQTTVKTIKNIQLGTKELSDKVTQHQSIFNQAGAEFGVDPYWLMAICMQESGGRDIIKAARGLMQIENGGTTNEFIAFGKNRPNGPYNSADRSDPNKAIPFAAKRLSDDFKHYSGDYLKTTQAYNFSKYSLDKLLKAFPNGDEWMNQRVNVGKYNGTNRKKYGDPKYIENVFRYYHGNQIPADGIGTVSGGTGVPGETTTESTQTSQETGFSGMISDLTNIGSAVINKRYGFDTITNSNESPVITDDEGNMQFNSASGDTSKLADEWFIGSLGARMSSPYGPRIHPKTGKYGQHTGIDYAALGGTSIPTPIGGTVIYNGYSKGGYGNFLKIKDYNNGIHLFAHMQEKSPLAVGSFVSAGQPVGKVGTTGSSTGNHLHYEVRTSDKSDAHTDPNVYWSKLSNDNKSNVGKESKAQSNGGKGGVDQPIKAPNLSLARKPIGSKEQPIRETNMLDNSKLLAVIIDILHKIANNTSSLSSIVELLSKSLNINIPEESIKEIKSNNNSLNTGNKQIVNIIKNSIKNDSSNPGNEYLLQTLEKLALE